ncbi:uncharacterized protein B0P05DRAFT_589544 [Gilbertella persicaria]|uniref:uncharacterized protein n=1 Tax=Gilbertella persicaria TaxID=101096 RepID=UPI002220B6B9|nr:uncharacterized protein B0P05DRAFT_589544 [Gilbertella persicaria]KAI8068177.1 hypothetical protein B0P05DRAFT_589544 [Gilbertella persicaria]
MRSYESAILVEMQTLVDNINKLQAAIQNVNENELTPWIDELRAVEKKMQFVYTFFGASKYPSHNDDDGDGDNDDDNKRETK